MKALNAGLDLLPAAEPGPMDRLLGRRPARNAWVELHNLIVAAADTREFGPEARARIGRRYGVDLAVAFYEERLDLYAALLAAALADGALTGAERRRLAHVARTLALDVGDLAPVHDAAFGRVVGEALADGCLSVEERLLLYAMQRGFELGPQAEAAYAAAARAQLVRAVAHALCDGALSPEEDRALHAQAEALDLPVPEEIEALLARGREVWAFQERALQPLRVELPVKRQRGEACYLVVPGTWRAFEARLDRRSAPPSLTQAGRARARERADQARRARRGDVGTVFVTNRRVLLQPRAGRPHSLTLRNVVRAEPLGEVTLLLREGTRHYALHPLEQAIAFPVLLTRLMQGEGEAS